MAHYVATIDIKKVSTIEKEKVDGSGRRSKENERVVDDITHVVVRADGMEELVSKATKILEIEIEE